MHKLLLLLGSIMQLPDLVICILENLLPQNIPEGHWHAGKLVAARRFAHVPGKRHATLHPSLPLRESAFQPDAAAASQAPPPCKQVADTGLTGSQAQ